MGVSFILYPLLIGLMSCMSIGFVLEKVSISLSYSFHIWVLEAKNLFSLYIWFFETICYELYISHSIPILCLLFCVFLFYKDSKLKLSVTFYVYCIVYSVLIRVST